MFNVPRADSTVSPVTTLIAVRPVTQLIDTFFVVIFHACREMVSMSQMRLFLMLAIVHAGLVKELQHIASLAQ